MTKKENNDNIENEALETPPKKANTEQNSEIFSRLFYSILFAITGWFTLWVFSFVVIIQFGFLLITGQVNTNLKGFNKEVGMFLFDLIKYLSFQTKEKPFPFRDWPYDEQNSKNINNSELNTDEPVKTSK